MRTGFPSGSVFRRGFGHVLVRSTWTLTSFNSCHSVLCDCFGSLSAHVLRLSSLRWWDLSFGYPAFRSSPLLSITLMFCSVSLRETLRFLFPADLFPRSCAAFPKLVLCSLNGLFFFFFSQGIFSLSTYGLMDGLIDDFKIFCFSFFLLSLILMFKIPCNGLRVLCLCL